MRFKQRAFPTNPRVEIGNLREDYGGVLLTEPTVYVHNLRPFSHRLTGSSCLLRLKFF
jgi:hypothetical protein